MDPIDRLPRLRLAVSFRRAAAPLPLLVALAATAPVSCASKVGPDNPAYDSEQPSNQEDQREERQWEERDEDL